MAKSPPPKPAQTPKPKSAKVRRGPDRRQSGGVLKTLFSLLFMAALGSGVFIYWYLTTSRELQTTPQAFTLDPGTTMRAAARQLEREGILNQGWLLSLYARATGVASKIKAGSYELAEPVTPLDLLAKLTDGDVTSSMLTIVEGWNWRQVKAALNKHPDLKHGIANLSDAEVARELDIADGGLEGQLFPDTYHFAKGSNDIAVIKRAHLAMLRQLDAAWAARAENLPLKSPKEVLILASIVEKETGKAADRPMVSAVFNNRLRAGMRLQTDPSVIYGMGENYKGNIRKVDLETDTPWNTYTRQGLTPTPIAMPGTAALFATVNPAPSKALYFVAKGDGSSYFSETLAEHNQAVRRYQLGAK